MSGCTPPLRHATLRLDRRAVETRHGAFEAHLFRDLAEARTVMVLARGELRAASPLLVRVHSSCLTSECLMGCDCDCAEQLDAALARIASEGRGALVYLMQEGRGAGLSAKARDRMLVQASGGRLDTFDAYAAMGLPADLRRYDAVGAALALLGVRAPIRLLSNNPHKRSAVERALALEKLELAGAEALAVPATPFNRDYLHAKRGAGHRLARLAPVAPARAPERIVAFEPVAHAADPGRLVMAAYQLPVALPGAIVWLRSSVLVDRATGVESVVLTHGPLESPEAVALPGADDWIATTLIDRLPTDEARGRAALRRALAALVARGSGSVGVVFDEASLGAR